jgi:hypothetical protein
MRRLLRVPIILNHLSGVMAGLVPAIHVLLAWIAGRKAWMPATSAGMTTGEGRFNFIGTRF